VATDALFLLGQSFLFFKERVVVYVFLRISMVTLPFSPPKTFTNFDKENSHE